MRVVVVASLLVMSSCLAGCYDEYRQNQENSSDDMRNQISAKVSIIEVYIDSNTEGSSDNNSSSSEVKVDSILVLARLAGGSSNTTVSKISYLITCRSSEEGNQSLVLVSGALADSAPSELVDDTPLTGESELAAYQNFQFTIQLGDCAAAVGDSLDMRVLVDTGGTTVFEMDFDSTEVGRSVA